MTKKLSKPEGKGVGLDEWYFHIPDQAVCMDWRYLVEEARGDRDNHPVWNLQPDYQRGVVWTRNQQERFIGHVLTGGLVGPIYVQRYDGLKNAPAGVTGDDWIHLPNEVIDGQQRLGAIMAFMAGECNAQVLDTKFEREPKWVVVRYADFSPTERRRYLTSKVVYLDVSREDRLRFYLRLNGGGVPHTQDELDKVRVLLQKETNLSG